MIEHEKTGWLVEPDQLSALRDALKMLITDPGLRRRLGRARVAAVFRPQPGIDRLVKKFHDTARNSGRTGAPRDTTPGVDAQVQGGRHGEF